MLKSHLNPDACIACTTCVVHCPVAQATPNFLGPRLVGPAYERFRLLGLGEEESLHYCANCKNCDIACPHHVPISTFNMLARAEQCKKNPPSLRDWMVGHGETLSRWLGFIPAALRNVGMLNPLTRLALDALGVHRKSPLPAFAAHTFRSLFYKQPQPKGKNGKVVFFPGCYVDIYDPQTGLDMVWALNRAGYEVIVPNAFRCCGLPMVANGFWEDARKNAAINLAELRRWKREGVPVLTGCPSCALMFKADLPNYFPELIEQPDDNSVEDAQEFLLYALRRGHLDVSACRGEHRVVYHAPCHLRAQGLGLPGLELLQALPGVTAFTADAIRANAGCCGISGSYGFKKEKYEIAMSIGRPLFEAVRESGAQWAASECGTCRVQVKHGSGHECLHPVSLLRKFVEG